MSGIGVEGIGVCCPLGHTPAELWNRISAGQDGFRTIERFDLTGLECRIASSFSALAIAELCEHASVSDAALAYAILAGRRALRDANASNDRNIALVLATSAGAIDTHDTWDGIRLTEPDRAAHLLEQGAFGGMAAFVAEHLGLEGPRIGVSTACASGGHAFALAEELLCGGGAKRVLVVGSDAVHASLFSGFSSVGALSSVRCAPFGESMGMSLGEGAAAVVLSWETASSRYGYLLGWGGSSDAYHPTAPEPRGTGVARSIDSALRDSAVSAAEVGYYNAHGTGTAANDGAEALAVDRVLGPVFVSSSKSQLGHTQGAAGVLEAVVTWLGLVNQALPPSLRSMPPRRLAPKKLITDGRARSAEYDVALSQSAAFGGTNVTVTLGRNQPPHRAAAPRRRVFARGVGAIGPWQGSLAEAFDDCVAQCGGEPDPGALRAALTGLKVRRLDPVSALLTAAVGRALEDADERRHRGENTGMVVGMADGPQSSIRRFIDSRDSRGLGAASAADFARMVLNAPTGAASYAFQLRGPSITLWCGPGVGLQAVVLGALTLSRRADLETMMVGGADEIGHLTEDRTRTQNTTPMAAAGALLLDPNKGQAELVGTAVDGPERWHSAVDRAVGERAVDRVVVSVVGSPIPVAKGLKLRFPDAVHFDVDDQLGHAPASNGPLACGIAVEWIRQAEAQTVLVLSVSRDAGSMALVWATPTEPLENAR